MVGFVNLVLLVLLPGVMAGPDKFQQVYPVAVSASVVTATLLVTAGTLQQEILFVAGRAGLGTTTVFLGMAIAIPHLFGAYYGLNWLMVFSPSYHCYRWFMDPLPLRDLVPVVGLYGGMIVLARTSLAGECRLERKVKRKLQEMECLKDKGMRPTTWTRPANFNSPD